LTNALYTNIQLSEEITNYFNTPSFVARHPFYYKTLLTKISKKPVHDQPVLGSKFLRIFDQPLLLKKRDSKMD